MDEFQNFWKPLPEDMKRQLFPIIAESVSSLNSQSVTDSTSSRVKVEIAKNHKANAKKQDEQKDKQGKVIDEIDENHKANAKKQDEQKDKQGKATEDDGRQGPSENVQIEKECGKNSPKRKRDHELEIANVKRSRDDERPGPSGNGQRYMESEDEEEERKPCIPPRRISCESETDEDDDDTAKEQQNVKKETVKMEHGSLDSDSELDDFSTNEFAEAHKQAKQKLHEYLEKFNVKYKKGALIRAKQIFTPEERFIMIYYLIVSGSISQAKGNEVWKRMGAKYLKHRTYLSLQNHFMKNILPTIESFRKIIPPMFYKDFLKLKPRH